MPHRVLMYTLTGDTTEAQQILSEAGITAEFELVGMKHEPLVGVSPQQIQGFEALVNEFAPVTAESIKAAAGTLRLISSLSIGLNHVDLAACKDAGICVSNCPGYCTQDVALHAITLMLDLFRKITASNIDVKAGRWNPHFGYPVHRPEGRTLGLVFFGNIARHVSPLAQALGMKVAVWAPTKSAKELAAAGCTKVETLDELMSISDVVSLHCPLIDKTRNLIGTHELELLGPQGFLINTARGALINEKNLLDALNAGIILGCGLDCLAHEGKPDPLELEIINHPHAVITPHSGYVSVEASKELLRLGLLSVKELLVDGITPTTAVV